MRLVLLPLALLFVPAVSAAPPAPRDLAGILQPLAQKYGLPGVVGAIVRGGHVVAVGSVGVRKVGDPAPFLVTDQVHLGSDTKAMTALLIGRLVDRKKLSFDSTMRELFPDLAAKMNPQMAGVTVQDLLDHDAGLPHDLDWSALAATGLPLVSQRRLAVEQALSAAPATPVGDFSYSNVGYVVLGAIVEAKTGLSWEQAMRREIFAPLGMDSAGFGAPGTPGRTDEPWGHVAPDGGKDGPTPVQTDNPPVMGPAGTVHCSIGDWSKFVAEILRSARGRPTLVSAATFDALTTPKPGQSYAGGWIVAQRPWAGGIALTHAGSNRTWYCDVWIAPAKDFAVLIASNYGGVGADRAADEGVGLLIGAESKLGARP